MVLDRRQGQKGKSLQLQYLLFLFYRKGSFHHPFPIKITLYLLYSSNIGKFIAVPVLYYNTIAYKLSYQLVFITMDADSVT